MIFESKFKNQNDMPYYKFLLDQLIFNGKTNDFMMEGPKQDDFLMLGIKLKNFKKSKSK